MNMHVDLTIHVNLYHHSMVIIHISRIFKQSKHQLTMVVHFMMSSAMTPTIEFWKNLLLLR